MYIYIYLYIYIYINAYIYIYIYIYIEDKKLSTDEFEARIVFVDHGSKSVRLSMRPHVLEMRGAHGLPALGSMLEGLTIKYAAKKQGVLLARGDSEAEAASAAMDVVNRVGESVDDEDEAGGKVKGAARLNKKMVAADAKKRREINESVLGVFIHRSALADLELDDDSDDEDSDKGKGKKPRGKKAPLLMVGEEDLEKQYHVGEEVDSVRVTGYHLVEGFAVATNIETAMASEILHFSEVTVGKVLTVTVAGVRDFGLLVRISAKVQAVCPLMHLSDTGLTLTVVQMNKKFRVGQTLKVRVWEVEGSAIIVTFKKRIVDDREDPILSYDSIEVGATALGVFITYAFWLGLCVLRRTYRQDYETFFRTVILSKHHHHHHQVW
jgi:hypothetical protein